MRRVRPTCFSSKLLQVPLLEKVGSCRDGEKFGGWRWRPCDDDRFCPSLTWKETLLFPIAGWGGGVVLGVGTWSALSPTDLTSWGVWWSYSTALNPTRYTDRSADPARAADLTRGP